MYDEKDPHSSHALVQEGWMYLDVRTVEEFEAGHPEGSLNIPYATVGPGGMMPNPVFLQEVIALFGPETGLVIGCASGGRSARACQMLAQMGYVRLVNVAGGFRGAHNAWGEVEVVGWLDSGLPTSVGSDEGSYVAIRQMIRSLQEG